MPAVSVNQRLHSRALAGARHHAPIWLKLRVHLHAFWSAPLAYTVALWWRLCGKRVRAHAQFAPMLASSPLAYRLWLLNEEPVAPPDGKTAASSPLWALLDGKSVASADEELLNRTLDSLKAENVPLLMVGTADLYSVGDVVAQVDWSNEAWFMPLAAGDILARGAARAYRQAMADTTASVIYGDDDLLDRAGRRASPHFKPGWNSELFQHHDFLTGACVVKARPGDLMAVAGPDWAAALVRSVSRGNRPHHIPKVLHHRHVRPEPGAVTRPEMARVDWPAVTVIVPTRNRLDLLRVCIEGLEKTDYPDLDIIIVDNGSDDPATLAYLAALSGSKYRVLREPGPFNFSTLNNRAAAQARGRLLCLLNNDIEMIEPDWLMTMVVQAMRDDVGAVGARLLYPNRRIQHAGVVLGICGGAAHAHRLIYPDDRGYFRRHALPQFVSAVTAACLVVQLDRFRAVGGLDEKNFAVAFNDVDLCMRLNQRGWQSLYEPRATLIHHESVSRGLDRDSVGAARLAGELAALKAAWRTDVDVDPFHHPELNRYSERFVVRL